MGWIKTKTISRYCPFKNPYRNLKSGELSRLCPETSKKLYVHDFCFRLA